MKSNLLFLLAASASIALTTASAQSANTDKFVADTERVIERAYLRASDADLAAAVKPLDVALASDPTNPALLYERAFAEYAASSSLRGPNNHRALDAKFESARTMLARVKGEPWEAEAAALQSSIVGQLIGLRGGLSGMTLGPKSGQLIAKAEKAAPTSPRVLLFRGISLINTPAMFGGDPTRGLKMLQQAVDAFGASDQSTPGPHWGRADALAWLGIAKANQHDTAGAKAAWEQALVIEPDYRWVKFALLPSLAQKPAR
jgi:tetratricopeptide (TPR) repeat protein